MHIIPSKNKILFLCLLFIVGTEILYAQQPETAHLRFLKHLATGVEQGELNGKSIDRFMFEEKISLIEGDITMLNNLLEDSSAVIEIAIADGKRCAASFFKDGLRVFSITYPADYQLLLGVTLMEAEDYLFDAVRETPIPPLDTIPVYPDLLTQQGNSRIYVKTGNSYIIPELNSNRYYIAITVDDTSTFDSLSFDEKPELDSIVVAEIEDSVEGYNEYILSETETLESIDDNGNKCILAFFRRFFGCQRVSMQEPDTSFDIVEVAVNSKQDTIIPKEPIVISDSLEIVDDTLDFELIFSKDMPVESMANLVTGNDIDDSINIDVVLVKYGYRTERSTVPIRQWIAFCRAEGCLPYFGVIKQDSSEIVCELIMHNELLGYAHVMKISFDPIIIAQRKGSMKARLNSYVPVNNLKRLFDEE